MIRKMRLEDIEMVQEIDKICFQTENTRRSELLKAFVDDEASLVYEEDGRIAGYIFNHVLGSFAWFGTLGVHPEYRGREIGKKLVNEAINIFQNEYKVKNIGLVTMPYSGYNIGFYMKLGFKPKELAVRLCKTIDGNSIKENLKNNLEVKIIDMQNQNEYKHILSEAKKVSLSLYDGLDMSPELRIVRDSNMGMGFIVYEKNEIAGFGVLRNKTVFNEESNSTHIRLLCIKNTVRSYNRIIDAVLHKIYEYNTLNGYDQLFIDINTVNDDICNYLLNNHGFKIDKTSLTLIMGDENFYHNINGVILFRTVS